MGFEFVGVFNVSHDPCCVSHDADDEGTRQHQR